MTRWCYWCFACCWILIFIYLIKCYHLIFLYEQRILMLPTKTRKTDDDVWSHDYYHWATWKLRERESWKKFEALGQREIRKRLTYVEDFFFFNNEGWGLYKVRITHPLGKHKYVRSSPAIVPRDFSRSNKRVHYDILYKGRYECVVEIS